MESRSIGSIGSIAVTPDRLAVSMSLCEFAQTLSYSRTRASTVCQQLRTSVEAYVVCLRHEAVLPERVIILVKSAVWEAIPEHLSKYDTRTLMDDVVRWSIDAYFDA